MSDLFSTGPAAPLSPASDIERLRNTTWLVHGLNLATLITGITGVVAMAISWTKRADTAGTIYESHLTYAIRTFWMGLAMALLCIVLCFAVVGFFLLPLLAIWHVVRCVRPMVLLNDGKPVPHPTGFI